MKAAVHGLCEQTLYKESLEAWLQVN